MVTLKVKVLRSLWGKSKGLIGTWNIEPVFFTTRWGIHTFGVLSPIDVVILDNNKCVVSLCRRLLPNRIYFWNPRFENVLELPAGEIDKKGIITGEKISFL